MLFCASESMLSSVFPDSFHFHHTPVIREHIESYRMCTATAETVSMNLFRQAKSRKVNRLYVKVLLNKLSDYVMHPKLQQYIC